MKSVNLLSVPRADLHKLAIASPTLREAKMYSNALRSQRLPPLKLKDRPMLDLSVDSFDSYAIKRPSESAAEIPSIMESLRSKMQRKNLLSLSERRKIT